MPSQHLADERLSGWSGLYDTFASLVRFQTELWTAVDAEVRDAHAVPLSQVTMLQLVATTDRCRVRDLVEALHITVGGASKGVDRMVEHGHLARELNPDDGRSSILELTSAGFELLQAAGPTIEKVLQQRLARPLDKANLLAFDTTLDILRTASSGRMLTTTQERRRSP